MAYEYPGDGSLDYYPCRYGTSRVLFRGPRRDLDRPYVAMLGSTETYGKFVPEPYPALTEAATGLRVVNLGYVNAGLDLYLKDPEVLDTAARARVTVVQIMGAQNLSNRFYTVHPRRNDRFTGPTPLLRALFRQPLHSMLWSPPDGHPLFADSFVCGACAHDPGGPVVGGVPGAV